MPSQRSHLGLGHPVGLAGWADLHGPWVPKEIQGPALPWFLSPSASPVPRALSTAGAKKGLSASVASASSGDCTPTHTQRQWANSPLETSSWSWAKLLALMALSVWNSWGQGDWIFLCLPGE